MAKHATNKKRNGRQKAKTAFAKAREDAQLHGLIPTSPEGTFRSERVDPLVQSGTPALPSLVLRAASDGWATPDDKKTVIVDELVSIATGNEIEIGPDGITSGPSSKTKVYAAKVLAELDQIEYERKNPEQAGKAKGGVNVTVPVGVGVEVNNNMTVFGSIDDLLRKAREQREGRTVSDGSQTPRGSVERKEETTEDSTEQSGPGEVGV